MNGKVENAKRQRCSGCKLWRQTKGATYRAGLLQKNGECNLGGDKGITTTKERFPHVLATHWCSSHQPRRIDD